MPGLWAQTIVQSKFFNDTYKAELLLARHDVVAHCHTHTTSLACMN